MYRLLMFVGYYSLQLILYSLYYFHTLSLILSLLLVILSCFYSYYYYQYCVFKTLRIQQSFLFMFSIHFARLLAVFYINSFIKKILRQKYYEANAQTNVPLSSLCKSAVCGQSFAPFVLMAGHANFDCLCTFLYFRVL